MLSSWPPRSTSGPLREVKYDYAGPTLERFHKSNAFVRGLMGPFGSGKSSACAMELLWRAAEQRPAPDGKRYTRAAIIRNTYPELNLTTLKTWRQWTAGVGEIKLNPPITHHIQTAEMDLEVIALALDSEEDMKKLLSLELTFAWLNEAREIPKAIFDGLTGRVGRYPSMSLGGASWYGIIADTNPPDTESWWYRTFEVDRPEGFELFRQPSGLSPEAENVPNLPKNYYRNISAGKSTDWIKVYVEGEYGFLQEGKPVYHNFRDSVHVAKEPLPAMPDVPLLLGVDFGLTPAAVIGQRVPDGRWGIVNEWCTEETGVIRFAQGLAAHVAREYPNNRVECVYTDPAGNQRAQTDERTAIDLLAEHTGWKVRPAPSNDWTMRLEVVLAALGRLIDGNPGILISPTCRVLRKGFNGGYQYKLLRSSTVGLTHDEKPMKNFPSHVSEALQYLLLGGGDAAVVMNRARRKDGRRRRAGGGLDYDLFDHSEPERPRNEPRHIRFVS